MVCYFVDMFDPSHAPCLKTLAAATHFKEVGIGDLVALAGDDLPQRVDDGDVESVPHGHPLGVADLGVHGLGQLPDLVVDEALHGGLAEAKVPEVSEGEAPLFLPFTTLQCMGRQATAMPVEPSYTYHLD